MSTRNIIAFVIKVNRDKALQARMASLPEDVNALVAFAAEQGFSFTADEWEKATHSSPEELSDQALNQVSGGLLPAVKPPQLSSEGIPTFTGGLFQRFR